jgi:phosphohistidine phosphatase
MSKLRATALDGTPPRGRRAGATDVFLVRHAIAFERNRVRWPDDALRPLTPSGERRFRKAARGLARCLPRSVVILTSPYVRARRTAEMLAAAMGRRARPIECDALAPRQSTDKVFELLRAHSQKSVVLVGHEPDLGRFLATALTAARIRLRVEFKKGGAASIAFEDTPGRGRATLEWFIPPRVLRSLA